MKQYTVYGSLIPRDDAPDERDAVYLASEVDARIAELEKAHARYELIRTLTPREFTMIWQENVAGCSRFDDLVDDAIRTARFKAKSNTL